MLNNLGSSISTNTMLKTYESMQAKDTSATKVESGLENKVNLENMDFSSVKPHGIENPLNKFNVEMKVEESNQIDYQKLDEILPVAKQTITSNQVKYVSSQIAAYGSQLEGNNEYKPGNGGINLLA